MRIFINDLEFDPPKGGFRVARTKQVNSIGRLDNRQASFTLNIKFPKTKRNVRNMKHLGSIGNTSDIPYTLNNVRLYNSSGEVEIFDGIAIPKKTTDTFNFAIYDGFISFTKAIENKVLTDIGLADLNHLKNLTTVKETWNTALNYKYLVADYNGKMIFNNAINIDYLIPSAKMRYLWDKVHEFAGFTYSLNANVLANLDKRWLSYPKTIGDGTQQTEDVWDLNWDGEVTYFDSGGGLTIRRSSSFLAKINGGQINTDEAVGSVQPVFTFGIGGGEGSLYNEIVVINETAFYKFTMSGTVFKIGGDGGGGIIQTAIGIPNSGVPADFEDVGEFEYNVPFSYTFYRNLEQGQFIGINGSTFSLWDTTGDVDINWDKVTGNSVDFEEAFVEFGLRDFVNEIMYRYSLTPFKRKYEKHIDYLTHEEWIQEQGVDDWSSNKGKFVGKIDEDYKLGGYAQKNALRYKYNDENFDHNDGFLTVVNKNLKDTRTVIQSKFFSPEPRKTTILAEEYNVYKFWEKEPKDDGTTDYKELDNRFYIMEEEEVNTVLSVSSEISNTTETNPKYFRERFNRLGFSNIIQDYYQPIYGILNNSKLITANVFLNDIDVSELDFKRLKFIREEGGLFILNKIKNYMKAGVHKCEFLRVDRNATSDGDVTLPDPTITVTSCSIVPPSGFVFVNTFTANFSFNFYTPQDGVTYLIEKLDAPPPTGQPTGLQFTGEVNEAQGGVGVSLGLTPEAGWYRISIIDPNEGIVSNYCHASIGLPNPNIEIVLPYSGVVGNPPPVIGQPYLGQVNYRFNDFTPTTATMRIQQWINGSLTGAESVYNDLNLTQDVYHQRPDCLFAQGWGQYRIRIETDTVSFDDIFLTF